MVWFLGGGALLCIGLGVWPAPHRARAATERHRADSLTVVLDTARARYYRARAAYDTLVGNVVVADTMMARYVGIVLRDCARQGAGYVCGLQLTNLRGWRNRAFAGLFPEPIP